MKLQQLLLNVWMAVGRKLLKRWTKRIAEGEQCGSNSSAASVGWADRGSWCSVEVSSDCAAEANATAKTLKMTNVDLQLKKKKI